VTFSAIWAVAGTAVVMYIAVAAAGEIKPSEAEVATAAVALVAVLYAIHAWRQLWADERRFGPGQRARAGAGLATRSDRGRRGR
jgi:hypothetical protein